MRCENCGCGPYMMMLGVWFIDSSGVSLLLLLVPGSACKVDRMYVS